MERTLKPCADCGVPVQVSIKGGAVKCGPCRKIVWETNRVKQGLEPAKERRRVYERKKSIPKDTPVRKVCLHCDVEKDYYQFYKHSTARDGLYSSCIECTTARANRSFLNPGKSQIWGLDRQVFVDLFESQDRKCAICRTDQFGLRGPHVDHDHETWEIRGILCASCNQGLGLLGDDEEGLRIALEYVARKTPGRPTIPHNIRARERSSQLRQAKPRKHFDYKLPKSTQID